ncbi:MAG: urease accessory protein UreE [Caulobacteraceae bacterium]
MPRVIEIVPAGEWPAPAADKITLDQDARHRRRILLTSDGGISCLLDLPHAVQMRQGDALLLDDDRLVEIHAAPEDLLEVTAASPAELLKLAWHLGNRHLAAQVDERRILIRYDHVIESMLAGLGASVRRVTEPFDPEGGAYAGHAHSH